MYAAREENINVNPLSSFIFPRICKLTDSTASANCLGNAGGTADPFGFAINAFSSAAGRVEGEGSWAVTAS